MKNRNRQKPAKYQSLRFCTSEERMNAKAIPPQHWHKKQNKSLSKVA